MEKEDFETKCRECSHPLVKKLFDDLYNSPVNNIETKIKMMWELVFDLQEAENRCNDMYVIEKTRNIELEKRIADIADSRWDLYP